MKPTIYPKLVVEMEDKTDDSVFAPTSADAPSTPTAIKENNCEPKAFPVIDL